MADFGVYFEVTNNLGVPLFYLKSDLTDAAYRGPSSIPSDGAPHLVHLADPHFLRGAKATVYFTAEVGGELRQYAWYGACPVWSPDNEANGPGVLRFNQGGHPLTVTLVVDPSTPGWTQGSQRIAHVFLLMLENRSFDQMLGFSGITGTDAQTGRPTTVNGLNGKESNEYNGETYQVSAPADFVMPVDPGHEFTDVLAQLAGSGARYEPRGPYPPITDAGFVADYADVPGATNPGEIMRCYAPDQLPVLTAMAKEFAVCDGWQASMPGPTWPNRFFSLAASSAGLDHSPSIAQILAWAATGVGFLHGSIFDAVGAAEFGSWRIYAGDHLPMSAVVSGVNYFKIRDFDSRFAADLASGDYAPTFTLIEPAYGDVIGNTYVGGTSQHPMDDVTHGEALIKATYEAIRNSSVWNSSLLIVTWDEHGGYYDHAIPGPAVAPGDTSPDSTFNQFGFTFEQYGPRVPAVVVSPLIPRNLIDHRLYDHASIPATVERIFGLGALTQRDRAANDLTTLASLSSPRADCPLTLPDPAISGGPDRRMLAFEAGQQAVVEDIRAADTGNLPGFLGVALRLDLELDPGNAVETQQRFARIETRADARAYLDSVWQKVPPSPNGPQRSSEVR
jgi:phospholipase C